MKTEMDIKKKIYEQQLHIEREKKIMEKHLEEGNDEIAAKYERVVLGHRMAKHALKWVLEPREEC